MSQAKLKLQPLLRSKLLLSPRIRSPLVLIAGSQAPSAPLSISSDGYHEIMIEFGSTSLRSPGPPGHDLMECGIRDLLELVDHRYLSILFKLS